MNGCRTSLCCALSDGMCHLLLYSQCKDQLLAATSFVGVGADILACHLLVEVEDLVVALVRVETIGACPFPFAVHGVGGKGHVYGFVE